MSADSELQVLQTLRTAGSLTLDELVVHASISVRAAERALAVLKARGAPVIFDAGKWSLTRDVELLDRQRIEGELSAASSQYLDSLVLLGDVDSTNAYLLRESAESVAACLAEGQSAGRGRRGKAWISPYGVNIYLSLSLRWRHELDRLQGLSLAVGVTVVDALSALGLVGATLKWPNDVLYADRKLCGILVETSSRPNQTPLVVIGIGLNVHRTHTTEAALVDQPWTNLETASGGAVSRNRTAGVLLEHLLRGLTTFEAARLAPFVDRWRLADALYGRGIVVLSTGDDLFGVADGVDADGALRVRTDAGHIVRITGGEVTIRRARQM